MELCTLCPRKCNIDRSKQKGYCGVSDKILLARADLHFWEEPCISGKNGSGAVFFSGCNMHCVYCQNHEISGGFGKEVSVKRLSEIFLELQDKNAHNINLVTPTHYVPQIISALKIIKDKLNIPVVYNTSGYETKNTIKALKDYVDIYLTDIKYFDNQIALKYSNANNYFLYATEALSEMLSQKALSYEGDMLKTGVIVRHLVLPSHKNDSINILRELKKHFGTGSYILSLMSQYTSYVKSPDFPQLNRKLTSLEYKYVVNEATDLGYTLGYIQERSSAKEEYTPPFDFYGV